MSSQIRFSRSEVAKILGVTNQTVALREKNGLYPAADRDINNHRIYSIADVLRLQMISHNAFSPGPILEELYNKGLRDKSKMAKMVEDELNVITSNLK